MNIRKTIQEELSKKAGQRLAFLAPLAGYSDLPFRSICAREGSALQTTELVSAAGIRHRGLEASWRYLAIDAAVEGPVLIQLFGQDVDDFLYAVDTILAHETLSQAWGIDINMGCPVPKVVKSGAGSVLLDTPDLAAAIVAKVAAEIKPRGYKMSVKIRRGYIGETEVAPSFAVHMAEAGAEMITVHGRYREQYYSGSASWDAIARVEGALTDAGLREQVFLVANGDVTDVSTAKACITQTSADAVAIGRAAEGQPWVFRPFAPEPLDLPSRAEQRQIIIRHAIELANFLGEERAMLEFRKVLVRYSLGSRDAKQLRAKASHIETLADVSAWLEHF